VTFYRTVVVVFIGEQTQGRSVFEGNGGDLRIGLPMQSLHDGSHWRHTPLRLSVFIQAPQEPMHRIVAKHSTVRQLLDHAWLHLFRLDDGAGC
jgi:uncharacterized protein